MHIDLPYGSGTLPLDVPEKNLIDVVVPKESTQRSMGVSYMLTG
jgi:hypothetical protein